MWCKEHILFFLFINWMGQVCDAGNYNNKYGSFTRLDKLTPEYWDVLSPFWEEHETRHSSALLYCVPL
jgi:hypothetical protein